MKNTKRILAVLLLMALLVSSFLLSVSAEETVFKADGINDIEDVLEYYTQNDYIADNYEDGAWNTEYYDGVSSEVVLDPANSDNKVLKVTGKSGEKNDGKSDKYANASLTETLIVSFDIRYDSTMQGQYNVDTKMLYADGTESWSYLTMFSVNAKDGVFQYAVWNPTSSSFDLVAFDGIAPVADTWYNVVLFFDVTENGYYFKISCDNKETWITSEVYTLGGAEKMTCFELRNNRQTRSDKISLYLDNVEVYAGTFERNPANKNNITAQTLIDLEALYNNDATDSATKIRIAVVLDRLVNEFGYVPADSTPELNAVKNVITNAPIYIDLAFAQEFVNRANAIDSSAPYSDRVAFCEESDYYSEYIPSDSEIESADTFAGNPELAAAVIAARAVFAEEKQLLVKVAEDSNAFVLEMKSFDAANQDYDGYLKPFYDKILTFTNCDFTYNGELKDAGDFTMEAAVALYKDFEAKYTKLEAVANTFIQGAEDMASALETMNASKPGEEAYEDAFAELANGYLLADSVYNNGDLDENLDESKYAKLNELFSVYLDNKAFIIEQIEACDKFIEIMKKADTATYYNAKLEFFVEADACVDDVRSKYTGVSEALTSFNALKDYINSAQKNSAAYIEAVEAVKAATTFEEKKAAIEKAVELQATGEIIGIEGVKEASIVLSEEMAKLETVITGSEAIKTLVAAIEKATTFAERRALLAKAAEAADNAELSIEGVAEAVEKYNSFMEEYNAAISSMNETHKEATENAADLASAAVEDADVNKAVYIIKDFVD